MDDRITQLVQELFDGWNSQDVERVIDLYALDCEGTDIGQASPAMSRDGERARINSYLKAFPDLTFRVEHVLIQDNQAAVVWTAQGTHQGSLMNIPATGHSITVRGMSLLKIEENKIQRALYVWDLAGLLREIGLLPEL
jgi:steroid delta-isomerase-like uncharacterized protein